jgi:hypothetical protein
VTKNKHTALTVCLPKTSLQQNQDAPDKLPYTVYICSWLSFYLMGFLGNMFQGFKEVT